jgi:hypothetical protein
MLIINLIQKTENIPKSDRFFEFYNVSHKFFSPMISFIYRRNLYKHFLSQHRCAYKRPDPFYVESSQDNLQNRKIDEKAK